MSGYEAAITFLGEWGPFQQQVFFLLCLTFIPNGLTMLIFVFVGDTPFHQCIIPAHFNLTAAWMNISIPLEEDSQTGALVLSKCSRYKLDVIQNFSDRGLIPGVDVNLSNVQQEGCLDGWKYDNSIYRSTIVTEWDLVCDDKWKKPLTSSLFYGGSLTGSFITGQLADRYGRKVVLFGTLALQSLCSGIQVFSSSWPMFCILFFFVGFGETSSYVSAFVLGSEILNPHVRKYFSTGGAGLSFAVGYMLLPLFAYFIRDWKMLFLSTALTSILLAPLWWLIPESPQWLLSQGKEKEAEDILRKAAKKNKVEPPPIIFSTLQTEHQIKKKRAHNICDLFRSRNICWISVTLWLIWSTANIGYYGVSLNTSNLLGNIYINCFLSAMVEIPAYALASIMFRWCSRRLTLSAILISSGLFLFFKQLIPASLNSLAIALEMMGKLTLTTAFGTVYGYSAEIYPTVLRNTAVGTCSMVSRIGSISAPYIIFLRSYWAALPYVMIISHTILSGLVSLLLPETFGMPLPQKISQMQQFPGCCQQRPYTVTQNTEDSMGTARKSSVEMDHISLA